MGRETFLGRNYGKLQNTTNLSMEERKEK